MTHDELLVKIIEEGKDIYANFMVIAALRAVVELHQPDPYSNKVIYCAECECLYPCPTIRAIKVELS